MECLGAARVPALASSPAGATHSAWALSSSTRITTRAGGDESTPSYATRSNARGTTALGAVKLGVGPESAPTDGPPTCVPGMVSAWPSGSVALPASETISPRFTSWSRPADATGGTFGALGSPPHAISDRRAESDTANRVALERVTQLTYGSD